MSNKAIYEICIASLRKLFEKIKDRPDLELVKEADFGLYLVDDLKSIVELMIHSPEKVSRDPSQFKSDSDLTNYDTYKLLHSFGLTNEQLIWVAQCEGLHELRILRMLRTVQERSLDDAQEILRQSEIKATSSTGQKIPR